MKVRNEEAATYNVSPEAPIRPVGLTDAENAVITEALRIIMYRLRTPGELLTSPAHPGRTADLACAPRANC